MNQSPLLSALCSLPSDLYLVGGPVRDALLGRPCEDWDIVCRGARTAARRAARKLKAKFITLDEQNKIYRVIIASPQPPPVGRGGTPIQIPRPLGRGRQSPGEAKMTLDFAELQGRTIEQDLGRRDFTINAMAESLTPPSPGGRGRGRSGLRVRGIIDPFGGQKDLERGIIRAVSERAFAEDPIRLLRAFRFAAQFGFKIEKRTHLWISRATSEISLPPRWGKDRMGVTSSTEAPPTLALPHKGGGDDHRVRVLGGAAAERIREELLKLMKTTRAAEALRAMDSCGLLSDIFPEIEACRRTAIRYYGRGGVLRHCLEAVENLEWILRQPAKKEVSAYLQERMGGYPLQAWLKLAVFLHDLGKPSTAKLIRRRLRFFEHEHAGAAQIGPIGRRLRLSRQEIQTLTLWVRNHMRLGNLAAAPRITGRAIARFFRDLGEHGVGMILASLADHYTYLAKRQWGKGKDPVEKMGGRLLETYFDKNSNVLPERLLNGHDLMRHFHLKPGPIIGKLLAAIQDAQADGKVHTKEEALRFAKRKIR
jgi:tRNA nucleotidyltransferase/poly(A) polymerase